MLPRQVSKQVDSLEVIFPISPIRRAAPTSKHPFWRAFQGSLLRTIQAQELLCLDDDSSSSSNLKGAVMDMMWLFAGVMGALLIGGLIVYKKSV